MSSTTSPMTVPPGTVEQGRTRIRAYSAGELVADAVAPLHVWEHGYFPQYYFLAPDIEVELVPAGHGPRSKVLGPSEVFDVVLGERRLPRAAQRHPEAPDPAMREAVTFTWSAMDTWLEEDELLHTHARSPYVRLDALPSSRHVVVELGGVVVADSVRPVALMETGLPVRYYLPRADVRMDLLTPTDTTSHCPYKGESRYWSVAAGGVELADVVWGYDTPLPESVRLAGLVCFWPEKSADLVMTVDGRRLGQD